MRLPVFRERVICLCWLKEEFRFVTIPTSLVELINLQGIVFYFSSHEKQILLIYLELKINI